MAAEDWLGADGKDRAASAERRAEQLVTSNRGILNDFGISAQVGRSSGRPGLHLTTSTRIGALPLLSPITGRPDFGLIVEPRFQWSSAGDMLAAAGFKVVPELLPLPELPQSERRIPPWVLSSIVLMRMKRLLDSLNRRFVVVSSDQPAPRGQVHWDSYATRRLPLGQALRVPCRYPDLRDDEDLRSAISWVIHRHRDALVGQTGAGMVVRHLLALCDELMARLQGVSPCVPTPVLRNTLRSQSISTRVFSEGLSAIEWTVEERGLAGLSDLSGLAWRMDMEVFFESWVEVIAACAGQRVGATLSAARLGQTRVPLDWQPPSLGSQRSLVPDVVLAKEDVIVVIDAKYKRHADDIERLGWQSVDAEVREQHRADVLQALAYSTLFDVPRIVACLAYPASPSKWLTLRDHHRAMARARVRGGHRNVELALLAVPLSGRAEEAAGYIQTLFSKAA